jgi:hypothetical protein
VELQLGVLGSCLTSIFLIQAGGVSPVDWKQHKDRLVELGISDGYPFPASITSLIYTTQDPAEIPTLAYNRPFL